MLSYCKGVLLVKILTVGWNFLRTTRPCNENLQKDVNFLNRLLLYSWHHQGRVKLIFGIWTASFSCRHQHYVLKTVSLWSKNPQSLGFESNFRNPTQLFHPVTFIKNCSVPVLIDGQLNILVLMVSLNLNKAAISYTSFFRLYGVRRCDINFDHLHFSQPMTLQLWFSTSQLS